VISVFSQEHKVVPALQAGADGYLIKSGDLDAIRDQIDRLIEGDVLLSTVVARHMLRHFRSAPSSSEQGAALESQAEASASHPPSRALSDSSLSLTPQQFEAMRLIAKGFTRAEVARHMGVSVDTVKTHIKRVYQRLGVKSRTEALFELKMIRLPPNSPGQDASDEAA
jgi:DNA-binding NarL/FixJ family response regulator